MRVLILGGAGFIGSNLAKKFSESKFEVSIIDGFVSETGASLTNLKGVKYKTLTRQKIESVSNLDNVLAGQDLIIDCMGWTSHNLGKINPEKDLNLNLQSHLSLLRHCTLLKNKKIIFLGTISQYNKNDIQGLNKQLAEDYFSYFSKVYGLNVISLRLPNCFGPNQKVEGDCGLIALMIVEILKGKPFEIYGKNHKRNVLFIDDLVNFIFKLSQKNFVGFKFMNTFGREILIRDFAENIIRILGEGKYYVKPLTKDLNYSDDYFSIKNLKNVKCIQKSDFEKSIETTIEYFKSKITKK